MLAAAVFPAPIASMTVAAPVTASPPANTPFLFVAAPSDVYLLCAHSLCASGCIHGYVSTAYYGNAFRLLNRRVILREISLHQIDSGQIFVSRAYAQKVFPQDIHEGRPAPVPTNTASYPSSNSSSTVSDLPITTLLINVTPWFSCGQTLPHTAGSALLSLII